MTLIIMCFIRQISESLHRWQRLGVSEDKFYVNLDRCGNTSAKHSDGFGGDE